MFIWASCSSFWAWVCVTSKLFLLGGFGKFQIWARIKIYQKLPLCATVFVIALLSCPGYIPTLWSRPWYEIMKFFFSVLSRVEASGKSHFVHHSNPLSSKLKATVLVFKHVYIAVVASQSMLYLKREVLQDQNPLGYSSITVLCLTHVYKVKCLF